MASLAPNHHRDRQVRAARRRNRAIERRTVRVQIYILAAVATLAFAHIADRAIAGWLACENEHLAQCPSFFTDSGA